MARIKALGPEPPVEAFTETVLTRLARSDEVQPHAVLVSAHAALLRLRANH